MGCSISEARQIWNNLTIDERKPFFRMWFNIVTDLDSDTSLKGMDASSFALQPFDNLGGSIFSTDISQKALIKVFNKVGFRGC